MTGNRNHQLDHKEGKEWSIDQDLGGWIYIQDAPYLWTSSQFPVSVINPSLVPNETHVPGNAFYALSLVGSYIQSVGHISACESVILYALSPCLS